MAEKVSFYIPAFNAQNTIELSINSVKNQTYPVDEIIIINDNSTDKTKEIISKHSDLKIINNKNNLGLGYNRNLGIQNSSNEIIASIDSDVELDKKWLENIIISLKKNNIVMCGGNMIEKYTSNKINAWREKYYNQSWGNSDILNPSFLYGCNTILLKSYWEKTKGYDENLKTNGEDIDFCLEIVNSFGRNFSTEPKAVVHHPWWNNGERTYRRFFRWAYGDSNLPALHPQHRWRNLPNTAELLTVCFIIVYLFYMVDESFPKMMLLAISGIIAGDFFSEWVRLLVVKRITNPIIAIESSCVRFSNDLGRVKAVVQSLKPWRITERFDYAATGEWIWGERKWAFTRFFLQTVVTLSLIDLLM